MTVQEIEPLEAWDRLAADPATVLVDVRTPMEWAEVGIPDLARLSRSAVLLPWQVMPGLPPDPGFVDKFAETGIGRDQPLLFLCRSGIRSMAAALAASAVGYGPCFNIATGYEGDPDVTGRRGTVNGWQADGLPWQRPNPRSATG